MSTEKSRKIIIIFDVHNNKTVRNECKLWSIEVWCVFSIIQRTKIDKASELLENPAKMIKLRLEKLIKLQIINFMVLNACSAVAL